MNTLLFHPNEIGIDGTLTLGANGIDFRAEHVAAVLNRNPGSQIRIGQIGGHLGIGEVLESKKLESGNGEHTSLRIRIVELANQPPAKLPLHLILALPRPKSLRRILRGVANFGIRSIDLIQSYRVEKSYWSTPSLEPGKIESALLDGLSIANDTVLPTVQIFRRFKPYVEDVAAKSPKSTKLIAHPYCVTNSIFPSNTSEPIALAIGPEGGWTEYEVELFAKAGFQTISLGPRVLSVEMAIPVLASSCFSPAVRRLTQAVES